MLLEEPIHILEILESEGNQQSEDDKFNRVDIKAKDSKDEIIIVEIQNTRELYYLERILYGVAKAITEHITLGNHTRLLRKSTPSVSCILISEKEVIIYITDKTIL